jgi:hypothetical protein
MLTKTLVFLVQSGPAILCKVMYTSFFYLLLARAGGGLTKSVIHTTADSLVEQQKPKDLSQGKQIKGTT